jgi:hypothetical protein
MTQYTLPASGLTYRTCGYQSPIFREPQWAVVYQRVSWRGCAPSWGCPLWILAGKHSQIPTCQRSSYPSSAYVSICIFSLVNYSCFNTFSIFFLMRFIGLTNDLLIYCKFCFHTATFRYCCKNFWFLWKFRKFRWRISCTTNWNILRNFVRENSLTTLQQYDLYCFLILRTIIYGKIPNKRRQIPIYCES